MARTVFLFWTVCRDNARAQELSDWYDNIHIPDVVAIPGFTSCIRYTMTGLGVRSPASPERMPGDYLSVVESVDEPDVAILRLQEAATQWQAKGRMSDLFQVLESAIVTQLNPRAAERPQDTTLTRTVFLFWTMCKDRAREQELSSWYDEIHIADVVAIPGYSSCIRYRATDLVLWPGSAPSSLPGDYLSIVESSQEAGAAIASLQAAAAEWRANGRMTDLFQVNESTILARHNPPVTAAAR